MRKKLFGIIICAALCVTVFFVTASADETGLQEYDTELLPAEDVMPEGVAEPSGVDTAYASGPNAVYTLEVPGVFRYDLAQEGLSYLNAFRANNNVAAVKMDADMMEAAMQRAAEIAVDFDHKRPDGTDCFTVLEDWVFGENILIGGRSAGGVVQVWEASDGHRSNMVDTDYKCVGIGCFQMDDVFFWVQLFSVYDAKTVGTRKDTAETAVPVVIKEGNYPVSFNPEIIPAGSTLTGFTGTGFQLVPARRNPGVNPSEDERYFKPEEYCEFSPESFTWTSSDSGVASVENGFITALSVGDTVITATAGSCSVSLTVMIRKDIKKTEITLDAQSVTYNGEAQTVGVSVKDGMRLLTEGTDYSVSAVNNVDVGTATLSVTGEGLYAGTKKINFKIDPRNILDEITVRLATEDTSGYSDLYDYLDDNVTLYYGDDLLVEHKDYWLSLPKADKNGKIDRFRVNLEGNFTGYRFVFSLNNGYIRDLNDTEYTGKEITPELMVFFYREYAYTQPETVLKEEDYTSSFENNINAGTATVTVKANEGSLYFGSFQQTFKILPVAIKSAALKYESVEYTGKKISIPVTVRATVNNKTVTLKKGRDYTVSYRNNKNVGTATVTIQGTGNYKGTLTKTFRIVPASTKLRSVKSKSAGSITVLWTKNAKQTSGYEIQYSKKKSFKSAGTVTIDQNKTTSTVIKKLSKGKTYYVRIRTCKAIGGEKYYSAWSETKSVKVK